MKQETKDKEIKKGVKVSKNILYSTKVFGEKENEINPNIILIPLNWVENKKSKNMALLLLKYKTLEGQPLEVIIATVDATYNRQKKLERIVELIKNQLRDNAREKDGYKYYKELKEYMKAENVPLKFTLEGLEILSTKNPKEISIERTFGINDDRKVEILITDEEFEKRRSKVPEVVKYELWQEGRNAIIKGFKTEKERQAFLNGEKIAKIMQSVEIADEDTEKVIETKKKKQRNLVANYLLGIYDRRNISNQNINEQSQSQQDEERIITLRKNIENGINTQPIDKQMRDKLELLKRYLALMDNRKNENEQNNNRNGENKDNVEEQELLRKYLNIKEKGLAIDANIVLESLEKDVNKRIEDKIDKQVEISPEDSEYAKKLQNGQHFFDLVKKGFDRTSRIFALTTGKVDFDFLEKLIQNYNGQDKELLEYIEFKRKILEQAQTEDIQNKEDEYPAVRELYKFLVNSSVREITKKDDENTFSRIFESVKRKLLKDHAEEINLYNCNAKPFKIYLCPTYETEKDEFTTVKSNQAQENEKQTSDTELEIIHQLADKIIEESKRRYPYKTGPNDPGNDR